MGRLRWGQDHEQETVRGCLIRRSMGRPQGTQVSSPPGHPLQVLPNAEPRLEPLFLSSYPSVLLTLTLRPSVTPHCTLHPRSQELESSLLKPISALGVRQTGVGEATQFNLLLHKRGSS